MAAGDQQHVVVEIVSEILGTQPQGTSFEWLVNKIRPEDFKENHKYILHIFNALGGEIGALNSKAARKLTPDAYYGGQWNFIFEFDELQHFTSYKLKALAAYPQELKYGFPVLEYIELCRKHFASALSKGPAGYRKERPEFPFENGRAAQRALFDAFRDILPSANGLNPTIRISEFDIASGIGLKSRVKEVLKARLGQIGLEL